MHQVDCNTSHSACIHN